MAGSRTAEQRLCAVCALLLIFPPANIDIQTLTASARWQWRLCLHFILQPSFGYWAIMFDLVKNFVFPLTSKMIVHSSKEFAFPSRIAGGCHDGDVNILQNIVNIYPFV